MQSLVIPAIEDFTENTTIVVTEGNEVMITCEAIGYPPPLIVWSRSDTALSDRVSVSDGVSVSTGYGNVTRVSANLTITNASREDTGVYTCSANSSIGSDSSNVNITVQCKCDFPLHNSKQYCIAYFVLQLIQQFYQTSLI